jgi:hypothetical protein
LKKCADWKNIYACIEKICVLKKNMFIEKCVYWKISFMSDNAVVQMLRVDTVYILFVLKWFIRTSKDNCITIAKSSCYWECLFCV